MPDADIPIPALLRAARGAYGHAIRRRLAAASFDDVPRSAPFILGGMGNHEIPADALARRLGPRRQELLDTLVERGYLELGETLELTQRGKEAALEVRSAVEEVDRELASQLTAEQLDGLRAGLVALTTIREQMEEAEGRRG
jgi:hypothetical protein